MTLTTLLVGTHFRGPPSKQVLLVLPSGTELRLESERDNPWDEWAIRVHVSPKAIPPGQHPALELGLEGTSLALQEVLEMERIELGYVAKTGGKPLQGTPFHGNQEFYDPDGNLRATRGTLAFTSSGQALLIVEAPR